MGAAVRAPFLFLKPRVHAIEMEHVLASRKNSTWISFFEILQANPTIRVENSTSTISFFFKILQTNPAIRVLGLLRLWFLYAGGDDRVYRECNIQHEKDNQSRHSIFLNLLWTYTRQRLYWRSERKSCTALARRKQRKTDDSCNYLLLILLRFGTYVFWLS